MRLWRGQAEAWVRDARDKAGHTDERIQGLEGSRRVSTCQQMTGADTDAQAGACEWVSGSRDGWVEGWVGGWVIWIP